MRVINQDDLTAFIPDEWYRHAEVASDELESVEPGAKSEFIEANSDIWRSLKPHLYRVSQNKCWYSEVELADTDFEIDHYRPKGRIAQSELPHCGYWWLAFDVRNFRLASPLVNKRRTDLRQHNVQGKGALFPLLNENERVCDDALPPRPTTREKPVLIDPCKGADVALLDYAVERGKVTERYPSHGRTVVRFHRANRSIMLYHLNEGILIKKRKRLQVRIELLAQRVDELAEIEERCGLSAGEESEYEAKFSELSQLIGSSAEFSAFARACIQQRGERGWTEALLRAA